jgi:L,D-peptidoglycan transpeptidase YkuD (ErfK/YbiS/YcfS/YnhG family)
MRRLIFFLFIACSAVAQNSPIPKDCHQIVVVVTKGWSEIDGQLRCFDRQNDGGWVESGRPITVVIGRHGLALAGKPEPPRQFKSGDTIASSDSLPFKSEGDGCIPAGVFKLTSAFGYAPPDQASWIKLPYIQCTDAIECVDDGKSSHYNQVLDATKIEKRDWNSSEQMHRKDVLYRWGVVIEHNPKRRSGDGSCIFMHIWEGPHKGTTGCTAMEENDLKRVMAWLDPKAKPMLVQFPENEYVNMHRSNLPRLNR